MTYEFKTEAVVEPREHRYGSTDTALRGQQSSGAMLKKQKVLPVAPASAVAVRCTPTRACRFSAKEYFKAYRETHKEYFKEYRETHKEAAKEYREIHKEHIAATHKIWSEKNRETILAQQKEWRNNNKERRAAGQRARREILKAKVV